MVAQQDEYSGLNWRKSTASAGAGECVEVAKSDSLVLARDSQDRTGAVLKVAPAQWFGLTHRIKNDEISFG